MAKKITNPVPDIQTFWAAQSAVRKAIPEMNLQYVDEYGLYIVLKYVTVMAFKSNADAGAARDFYQAFEKANPDTNS